MYPLYLAEKGDNNFEVVMHNEESVKRLLTFHLTEKEGSVHPLHVKNMPVQFSVVDIFDLIEKQLGEAEHIEAAFPRGSES